MYSILIGLLATAPCTALACPTSLHPIHSRSALAYEHRFGKRVADAPTVPSSNTTHWTTPENLREMQVTDDAFNAQDLEHFNHAADVTVYNSGGSVMNLTEHLTDMRLLYSMFPDAGVHNHNYPLRFGEGDWTVTLTKFSGTNDGPMPSSDGSYLPPTRRTVSYPFMTIGHWEYGLLQEEYLFQDTVQMYRQLGFLPGPPPSNLPDINFDLYGNTGKDDAKANKKNVNSSDTAFNAGSKKASDLLFSENLTVYGLTEMPMHRNEYMRYINQSRVAFPDLHYQQKHIIAEGEWTATVGILSGTHRGQWVLPPYIAEGPIAATGKNFSLLHYIISRWNNGEIVDMRVNFDVIGVLESLGVGI